MSDRTSCETLTEICELSNAELDAGILRREARAGLHPFVLLGEAASRVVAKLHLIKGIFARGETSAWIAPPGGLKSALLASAAFAVATGADWFGFRNKGAAPVVIVALERADLVERRLRAHADREGLERLPQVAIIKGAVNLMRDKSLAKFIATLRAIEAEFDAPIGLLVFDTFAKLIAAGGGDEDKARDQNAVFANIQQVKDAIGCHVALIGHTGKDESRGARGSSALPGDVDLLVMISGGEVKTATVTKANDAPEGALFSFTSDIHEFGVDADGDPVSVNVAVRAERGARGEASADQPRLTKNQRTMFAILHDAGPSGLTSEDWNARVREAGIGIRRKADIFDARASLKAKGLIRQFDNRWSVNHH